MVLAARNLDALDSLIEPAAAEVRTDTAFLEEMLADNFTGGANELPCCQ